MAAISLPTGPPGYEVMSKQGSIILGIGGDTSDGGIGTFCKRMDITESRF